MTDTSHTPPLACVWQAERKKERREKRKKATATYSITLIISVKPDLYLRRSKRFKKYDR